MHISIARSPEVRSSQRGAREISHNDKEKYTDLVSVDLGHRGKLQDVMMKIMIKDNVPSPDTPPLHGNLSNERCVVGNIKSRR